MEDSFKVQSETEAGEQAIASAVKFLIEGAEHEAALFLLNCKGTIQPRDERRHREYVALRGPRAVYEALVWDNKANAVTRRAVEKAFVAVGYNSYVITAELVEIDPNWRTEMFELIRGRGVTNQGADIDKPIIYQNLKFRSVSERRIAEALDRAGVLYLPNCRARLNIGSARGNREADFLVCNAGKFGILEVDGAPYHPPTRTSRRSFRRRTEELSGEPGSWCTKWKVPTSSTHGRRLLKNT